MEVHVEALDLGEAVGEQTTRSEQLGSAANPGVLRALVPIDVDGMPLPTGFELRANVMGLAVTYHVGTIDSLEPVPAHMKGTPAALKVGIKTDWSKWLLGPDVDAPICLDFGQKPAMQKHSMTFVIRNHTGIDSSYNLHFEEFGVAEHEVLMLNYAAAVEAAAQASRESRTWNKSPSRRQHTPPRSERSGAQSPKAKLASTSMMTTQSGFSVGSVEPRPSHKATKQTGTIATVRMGATMERAVATGAAGRVLTQAEGVVRKNRSMAPLLQDAEKQLGLSDLDTAKEAAGVFNPLGALPKMPVLESLLETISDTTRNISELSSNKLTKMAAYDGLTVSYDVTPDPDLPPKTPRSEPAGAGEGEQDEGQLTGAVAVAVPPPGE